MAVFDILRRTLCIALTQAIFMINPLIDTYLAGKVSPESIAGVGLGGSVALFVQMTLLGFILSLPNFIARHGRGPFSKTQHEWAANSLIVCILASAAGMLLFVFLSILFRSSTVVWSIASEVLLLNVFSLPGFMVVRSIHCTLIAVDKEEWSLLIVLAGTAIKVVLAILMYWYFSVGEEDIQIRRLSGPLASSIAMSISGFIAVYFYLSSIARKNLASILNSFDRKKIIEILAAGLPISLSLATELGLMAMINLIVGSFSYHYLAAHQIAINIVLSIFALPLSISMVYSIIYSKFLSVEKEVTARRVALSGLAISIAIGGVISFDVWIFGSHILTLYTHDVPTEKSFEAIKVLLGLAIFIDFVHTYLIGILRSILKTFAIFNAIFWGRLMIGGGLSLFLIYGKEVDPLQAGWIGLVTGLTASTFIIILNLYNYFLPHRRAAI